MSKLGEDVDHGAEAYDATGSVRRNRRREVDGVGELDRPRQGRHHFSMGKGYEENQARLSALSLLGKDLARRAKSTCELSLNSGVPLRIYEVSPVSKTPELDRCLMLSDEVIAALEKPSLLKADEWRHLGELIWTELPIQQLMVVRFLQYLGKTTPWCQQTIEEAYLDDEVIAAAEAVPLG